MRADFTVLKSAHLFSLYRVRRFTFFFFFLLTMLRSNSPVISVCMFFCWTSKIVVVPFIRESAASPQSPLCFKTLWRRMKSNKPPLVWGLKLLQLIFLCCTISGRRIEGRTLPRHDLWQSNSLVKVSPITLSLHLDQAYIFTLPMPRETHLGHKASDDHSSKSEDCPDSGILLRNIFELFLLWTNDIFFHLATFRKCVKITSTLRCDLKTLYGGIIFKSFDLHVMNSTCVNYGHFRHSIRGTLYDGKLKENRKIVTMYFKGEALSCFSLHIIMEQKW